MNDLSLNNVTLSFDFIDALLPILPPLLSLSLAHCGMGQNTLVHLFNTLKDTASLTDSLALLDVSFNTLGPDGTGALAKWLTDCNP